MVLLTREGIFLVLSILVGLVAVNGESQSGHDMLLSRSKRAVTQLSACKALCGDYISGGGGRKSGGDYRPRGGGDYKPGGGDYKPRGGGDYEPAEGESQAEYNCKTWGHMCWGGHGKK